MYKLLYCYCLILAACDSPNRSLTAEEKSSVMRDVRSMFQGYFEAVRKEGLTGEFKYLDHSSDFFWVPPGYQDPLSYDSVATILRSTAPKFSAVENSFDTLRVIPLSPDLAAYTAKVRSVMKDTSGTVTSIQLRETGIVIKRDDGWKLLNGQTSLIP